MPDKVTWCKVVECTEEEYFLNYTGKRDYPDGAESGSWYYGSLPSTHCTPSQFGKFLYDGVPTNDQIRAFDESRKLCRNIVHKGLSRMIPDMTRKRYLSDDGDSIDIDAYLRRDLECWTAQHKPPTFKRTVNIVIELGVNAWADEDYFVNQVCGVGAYVEALEKKGFVVSLKGMYSSAFRSYSLSGYNVAGILFPIKHAGRRLNYKKFLTYGNPATSRVIGFRQMWKHFISQPMSSGMLPPIFDPKKHGYDDEYWKYSEQGADYTPWPGMYEAFDADIIVHPNVKPEFNTEQEVIAIDPYEFGVSSTLAQTVNTLSAGVLRHQGEYKDA